MQYEYVALQNEDLLLQKHPINSLFSKQNVKCNDFILKLQNFYREWGKGVASRSALWDRDRRSMEHEPYVWRSNQNKTTA